ncbi:MAG: hypothetical protein GC200_08975 [Tepidisphaera sp.]|nr:hypothetical protein [Tepidisphaera sp.]
MTRERGAARLGALALGALVVLCGCTETRIVKWNPMLGGLPGSESGTPIVRDFGDDYRDPAEVKKDELQETLPDGTVKLYAKTGRHLMIHIHNTLEENDKKLFVSQVLSQLTKRECIERGVDPGECFDYLKEHEQDIQDLFDRMPSGERTPGIFPKPLGNNVTRVELGPRGDQGLLWGGFDMVMEHGNYRLRWFVPAYK